MKLKHGQRCTCERYGTKITDAKISINKDKKIYICQNIVDGNTADNKLGYKYSFWLGDLDNLGIDFEKKSKGEWLTNLKLFNKTIETAFVKVSNGNFTIQELKNMGYKLKDEPEEEQETILTMDDVAEKFGVDVKNLKIKK